MKFLFVRCLSPKLGTANRLNAFEVKCEELVPNAKKKSFVWADARLCLKLFSAKVEKEKYYKIKGANNYENQN